MTAAVPVDPPAARPPGFVVVLAGPPGTGKTTVGRCVARALGGVLIDRDLVLAPIVAAALVAAGQDPHDLTGDYFRVHLNAACYRAAEDLAASLAAADGLPAVLVAPYTRSDEPGWHRSLTERLGVRTAVVWLTAPEEVRRQRIAARRAPRDRRRLEHPPVLADPSVPGRRPDGPHLVVDTATSSPAECAAQVLAHLGALGWASVEA